MTSSVIVCWRRSLRRFFFLFGEGPILSVLIWPEPRLSTRRHGFTATIACLDGSGGHALCVSQLPKLRPGNSWYSSTSCGKILYQLTDFYAWDQSTISCTGEAGSDWRHLRAWCSAALGFAHTISGLNFIFCRLLFLALDLREILRETLDDCIVPGPMYRFPMCRPPEPVPHRGVNVTQGCLY